MQYFITWGGHDSHLIMHETGKSTFDIQVRFIPNGLEKYMEVHLMYKFALYQMD